MNVRDAHSNLGGVTAGPRVPPSVGVSGARARSLSMGKHRRCQTGQVAQDGDVASDWKKIIVGQYLCRRNYIRGSAYTELQHKVAKTGIC